MFHTKYMEIFIQVQLNFEADAKFIAKQWFTKFMWLKSWYYLDIHTRSFGNIVVVSLDWKVSDFCRFYKTCNSIQDPKSTKLTFTIIR